MIIWEVVFPRYFTFIKNHPQNFVNRRSYTDEKTLLNMSIMNQSQWPLGLCRRSTADRLLGSWVRIPPRHGCPSVVSVVCCQVEVTATSWSPVQRSLAERGVSEYDREASIMRKPWLTVGCCSIGKNTSNYFDEHTL